MANKKRTRLYGMAPPDPEGHTRITRGLGVDLHGGSEAQHECMQEHSAKLHERLKKRGKTIHDARDREIFEILHDVVEQTG